MSIFLKYNAIAPQPGIKQQQTNKPTTKLHIENNKTQLIIPYCQVASIFFPQAKTRCFMERRNIHLFDCKPLQLPGYILWGLRQTSCAWVQVLLVQLEFSLETTCTVLLYKALTKKIFESIDFRTLRVFFLHACFAHGNCVQYGVFTGMKHACIKAAILLASTVSAVSNQRFQVNLISISKFRKCDSIVSTQRVTVPSLSLLSLLFLFVFCFFFFRLKSIHSGSSCSKQG